MNVFEIIKEYVGEVSVTDLLLCLSGSLLLAGWLLRTSLGARSLDHSAPRRNNMPLFLPLLILFVSYFFIAFVNRIATLLVGRLQDSQGVILNNLVVCVSGLANVVFIIILVRPFFARRLKGFGLNLRTIHKDFFGAFVNLLAIWPLIMVAFTLTMYFGHIFYGPEYQVQRHEGLETISEYPQLPTRILVTFVAIIVAPLFEELMFRGLFQTMIRSVLKVKKAAWLAIAVSSSLFVVMHVDKSHWPALFVLGVGLGYSYEKSGSLLRPIFMHMIFNATSVISVWIQ